MLPWQDQLAHSITNPRQLARYFEIDEDARKACEEFPVRIPPYVLSLAMRSRAVARQFLPDGAELSDGGPTDPLREKDAQPVAGIIHRYPDRLLLMAGSGCAANCRFCMRKGRVGRSRVQGPRSKVQDPISRVQGARSRVEDPKSEVRSPESSFILHPSSFRLVFGPRSKVEGPKCNAQGDPGGRRSYFNEEGAAEGVGYIRGRRDVRQVIISGGDPLLLEDDELIGLVDAVRSIGHVRVVRIHTRAPATLPMRITAHLCRELGRRQPLYVIAHFNHPDELTAEATEACGMLADAGVPLGNQSVLLRGVNDDPAVMQKLVEGLLEARVRPYYLHHPDGTRGTRHFDVEVSRGVSIIEHLRRHCSGLAVPQYVRDEPGAAFKRPLI